MSEWLRVGYVQGNMNNDNALLNGRTMDYGPFGFVDRPFKKKHQFWEGDWEGGLCEQEIITLRLRVDQDPSTVGITYKNATS